MDRPQGRPQTASGHRFPTRRTCARGDEVNRKLRPLTVLRSTPETTARIHHPADAPGLSIESLAQAARDFAPTKRRTRLRRRLHHGHSVGVTRDNPPKSLGKQLELGSLRGHHGS